MRVYIVYGTWPDSLLGKVKGVIVGLRDPLVCSWGAEGLQVSKAIVCWHNKF